jgi:putative ABC transport system permease protein
MYAQIQQIMAVVEFSLATIWSRFSATVVAIVGIAAVSLVLVTVLAASAGFQHAYRSGGANDVLLLLKASATSELGSYLSAVETGALREAVSTALGPQMQISEESYFVTQAKLKSRGVEVNVPVRGLGATGMSLRHGFHLAAGRLNSPGTRELIAGERASRDYVGLKLNDPVQLGNSFWTVVGVFTTDNEISNSELWGDQTLLQKVYSRIGSIQSAYLKLPNGEARFLVDQSIAKDKRLQLQTMTEAEYYEGLSKIQSAVITLVGYVVALGMGLVAIFVLIGSMQTSVSARARQIGILRAIGFSATPIFISILFETILISLFGGLLGGLLSYVLFDGVNLSTLNVSGGFTQVPFSVLVSIKGIFLGATFSAFLGLFAGLLPAWGASRRMVVRSFGYT